MLGKLIGVFGTTWPVSKMKIAEIPADLNWSHIFGIGLLAGIGFTMSLFVTNLAFEDAGLLREAKVGIFTASLISGTIGYIFLSRTLRKNVVES